MNTSVLLRGGLAALLCAPAAHAVTFEVLQPAGALTAMGTPGSISSDGSVVVGEAWAVDTWIHEAFRWTAGSGMEKLGLSLTSPAASKAWGTSDDGTVVAGWAIYADEHTFCWTTSGTQTVSSKKGTGVFGLAPDGSVAVGKTPIPGRSADPAAVKWTAGGTAWSELVLNDLSGGANRSTARRISGDKTTIVGWGTDASGTVACRWDSGSASSAQALGDLPGGRYFSEAFDVSHDGSVIIGRGTSADGIEAFRWTSSGGIVPLGELPGGIHFSEARSVSGDGAIVAGVSDSAAGREVFVWDATGGMRSLTGLLEAAGIDVTGWRFTYAEPLLSADGDTVVGNAITPEQDAVIWRVSGLRSILGSIPEPVVQLGPGTGGVSVTFSTRAGFVYQVQSCPTLDDPAGWLDAGSPIIGDGLERTIDCPDSGEACEFFRLAVSTAGGS